MEGYAIKKSQRWYICDFHMAYCQHLLTIEYDIIACFSIVGVWVKTQSCPLPLWFCAPDSTALCYLYYNNRSLKFEQLISLIYMISFLNILTPNAPEYTACHWCSNIHTYATSACVARYWQIRNNSRWTTHNSARGQTYYNLILIPHNWVQCPHLCVCICMNLAVLSKVIFV